MPETTTTTSNYTGKIEWEHTDESGIRTITDDGEIGGQTDFIDSGTGPLGVNEVWYGVERIDPGKTLVIDFSYLPIYAPGGKVHAGFTNVKAINIRNVSGDLVYIGNSGTVYGIDIFGERQTLGISGVAGWEAPLGRDITDSGHNIGITNPDGANDIIASIGIVGNPVTYPMSGSFNDDFSDDFQYIINA